MISPLTIAGTFWSVYAVLAFATGQPFWVLYVSGQTLREAAIVWMLILVFIGAINWIFER